MVPLLLACARGPAGTPAESVALDTGTPPPRALVFDGERPTNLLVISLDTARRDLVGFFDTAGLSPNLTSIFSSGVVLEDHRSCSNWTTPSTLCVQTGRFPLDDEHWPSGMDEGLRDPAIPWPPPHPQTLAELLTDDGYDTILVTANTMFSSEINGPASGFTVEDEVPWQSATDVVDAALRRAADLETERPWYLHVHFIDPHGSYAAPEGWLPDPDLDCPWDVSSQFAFYGLIWSEYATLDESNQALARACIRNYYGAEIRYWDDQLARLWAGLEREGILDDTLVVFWTDHGEQIGDHGGFQHGSTLYDEENRSTVAFWAKDVVPLRWTGPTIHQDVAPTILEALGLPRGDHTGIVVGEAPDDRARVMFSHIYGWNVPQLAVVQADRKLYYSWDGTKRLFDLSLDPEEQIDLYTPDDPLVPALWSALDPYVGQLAQWGLVPVDPGP